MEVIETDRCISWLPWYHDMGLVGCLLSPMANQISTDYLKTEDFARRPLAWLDLITRNEGTTGSYSPTFGYDICARRVSSQTNVAERFDLSRWRIAGNGADMIRPDVMQAFVDAFAPAGFSAKSFCPSYGLAEATLAVTIMPPGEGIVVELVEETTLSGDGKMHRDRPQRYRAIVNCGKPARDMEVEIRDEDGATLGNREIGKVHCRGPSVMVGYFRDEEATAACLDSDGWLDTGDMGYLSDGYLYIVGRAKDMIIINGKNHWPQDIEWAVEQLPGFKAGDIAAFSITTPGGEETPAVLVQCRTSDAEERAAPPRDHPRAGPGDHRNELRHRAGPAAHLAADQLGQAQPRQGAKPLPHRRDPALRHRRLACLPVADGEGDHPKGGGGVLAPRRPYRKFRALTGLYPVTSVALRALAGGFASASRRLRRAARCFAAGLAPAWQEWRDSNPRPSVLETDALTKLSYTPKARAQIAALGPLRKAPGVPESPPTALAIPSRPRYLASLACIGKARLTGPPVESGCPEDEGPKADAQWQESIPANSSARSGPRPARSPGRPARRR